MKIARTALATAFWLAGAAAQGQTGWSVVQTQPLDDRSAVMIATTLARAGNGGIESLSIVCRGSGRIEMGVGGPALTGAAAGYTASYRLNDGAPVQLGAGVSWHLGGTAFPGDSKRLLQSLPGTGQFAVRLVTRQGIARDATFLLDGLEPVREKAMSLCGRS